MTRPGIEPRSPGPLANTLTIMPIAGIYIYIYIHIHKCAIFINKECLISVIEHIYLSNFSVDIASTMLVYCKFLSCDQPRIYIYIYIYMNKIDKIKRNIYFEYSFL